MEKQVIIDLITKLQNGDADALQALFNEAYNDIYHFVLKTVKDEKLACDITLETFTEIFENINELNEPSEYLGWTRKIAFDKAAKYFNNENDESEENELLSFDNFTEEKTEFAPDEALDGEEFKKLVVYILNTLTEEQRSAIMMYYLDELSAGEIADIQGVSEGIVNSRLNYGRKAVKASVEVYEKNHAVKLNSVPFFSFFKWLFADSYKMGMPAEAAESMAMALSESTGKSFELSKEKSAKKVKIPLAAKITAGVIAGLIVLGGIVASILIVWALVMFLLQ